MTQTAILVAWPLRTPMSTFNKEWQAIAMYIILSFSLMIVIRCCIEILVISPTPRSPRWSCHPLCHLVMASSFSMSDMRRPASLRAKLCLVQRIYCMLKCVSGLWTDWLTDCSEFRAFQPYIPNQNLAKPYLTYPTYLTYLLDLPFWPTTSPSH